MKLIRPRLTDFYGVHFPQAELDFAVPFFSEDIPLYVDPFLLWKSPSYQDKALHGTILNNFNYLGYLAKKGRRQEAISQLIVASECEEVGLGVSPNRKGVHIGEGQAHEILALFERVPQYDKRGFEHLEEIQFFVDGIAKDRISDFACSFMKSFLIDFTIDQCEKLGLPISDCRVNRLYDLNTHSFAADVQVKLPINPVDNKPLLLVPKRWLRYTPWLGFDEYFRSHCPLDDIVNPNAEPSRVRVLMYNRDNYGAVEAYVREKERTAQDCINDPLFEQIPVLSAKRKFAAVKNLPTGKNENADRKYEDVVSELLASLLYPHLDFAEFQSRTDSGVNIRDVIFYTRCLRRISKSATSYGTKKRPRNRTTAHQPA